MSKATFGVVRVADFIFAVPAEAVREVIAAPAVCEPFPGQGRGLLGCVVIRGLVLPVIDTRLLLGIGGERPEGGSVVVLRKDSQLVGLLVDATIDVVEIATSGLQPYGQNGAHQGLCTHSVLIEGRTSSLIDVLAVFAAYGGPSAIETERLDHRQVEAASVETALPYLHFDAGGFDLVIDVAMVEATVPETQVRPGVLTGGICDGTIDYHGADVAIVQSHATFGLGPLDKRTDRTSAVILRLGGGLLAIGITAVLDLVHLRPNQIALVSPTISARPQLLSGCLLIADRPVLVLDGKAIEAETQLRSLGNLVLNRREAASSLKNTDRLLTLIFEADGRFACVAQDVSEITPLPENWQDKPMRADGMIGLFSHRGQLVPVFRLNRLLGRAMPALSEQSRILICANNGTQIGLVVDKLVGIDHGRRVAKHEQKADSKTSRGDTVILGESQEAVTVLSLSHVLGSIGHKPTDGQAKVA